MDFYDRQTQTAEVAPQDVAASHAEEVAAAGDLPKWEYRVLTESALAGWGAGEMADLESLLNHHAQAGWRVISMSFTGQVKQTFATDKNHLYVVLERPVVASTPAAG